MPDALDLALLSPGAQALHLARLIVETLDLRVDPTTIDPGTSLTEDGLGLDSIDMLEIALAVSRTYGVELRADDTSSLQASASLASLAQFIWQRQQQG